MKYIPRPYQQEAIDNMVNFFKDKNTKKGGLAILPTAAGKSICISNTAKQLDGNTLILQPNKEILVQNYDKLLSYGETEASIYSASLKQKEISKITFATIGSIIKKTELFKDFNNILIDECHLVSSKGGMYKDFLDMVGEKVLGLTATPYRLSSDNYGGSQLKFLTRTRPNIFSEVVHVTQIGDLMRDGYLSKLTYFQVQCIKTDKLLINSTGADYTDESIRNELKDSNFDVSCIKVVKRLLAIDRKSILVFTRFVEDAEILYEIMKDEIPCAYIHGETPANERDQILKDFKNGNLRVVFNCQILTTGFDHPELDAIVLARPTMSLALYYQIVGRGLRIPVTSQKKDCMIVDMCETYKLFGKVEDLEITTETGKPKLWCVKSHGKQLTNVYYNRDGKRPTFRR